MGCVSSTFLSQDDEFSQIGGSTAAFSHHIVALTSTTYGLLTLDPPPSANRQQHLPTTTVPPTPSPPPRTTLGSLFPSPLSEPRSVKYHALESINTWDLMSGLDADHIPSFRLSPLPSIHPKPCDPPVNKRASTQQSNEENIYPHVSLIQSSSEANASRKSFVSDSNHGEDFLDSFELICPPNGENKVVLYTTTLRGVRKTFDDCNAVRSAIEGLGISVLERDISMDRGFRDELREMMEGRGSSELIPPRVFIKGRYIGGFEEVMRAVEEGVLGELLEGLPRFRDGYACEGCGGMRFLPCFECNGSCKTVGGKQGKMTVIERCSSCNENGLVRCPICG